MILVYIYIYIEGKREREKERELGRERERERNETAKTDRRIFGSYIYSDSSQLVLTIVQCQEKR